MQAKNVQDEINTDPNVDQNISTQTMRDILESKAGGDIYIGLVDAVSKTASETIPDNVALKAVYARPYKEDGRPALQVSILTEDLVVHDFTVSQQRQKIVYVSLKHNPRVDLKVFYQELENDIIPRLPYRAELMLGTMEKGATYSAEGSRRLVESLISYGKKCLQALHRLDQGE